MSVDRAVAGVVAVVVVTVVVSGPLVGAVDLTGAGGFDAASLGEGTATASDASLPGRARLVRGDLGADGMYLEVPPATVDVEAVTGRVRLSYRISIESLGYTRGTTHFVGRASMGTYRVTLDRAAVDPDRIAAERYDATLSLVLYDDGGRRTLAERPVTVEVDR